MTARNADNRDHAQASSIAHGHDPLAEEFQVWSDGEYFGISFCDLDDAIAHARNLKFGEVVNNDTGEVHFELEPADGFGVWCTVSGGVTGSREAWLKEEGQIWYGRKAEAEKKATDLMAMMGKHSAASFSYRAASLNWS